MVDMVRSNYAEITFVIIGDSKSLKYCTKLWSPL